LERDVRVQLRRFGNEWVTVGNVPSRTTAVVELPGLHSATPWMLRAPGACRVRDTPTAVIVTPKAGAVVTGSVTLAATTQNVYVTKVEFRLSGEGLDDALLGTGTPGFGWALRWDTTSVPDGTYRLTTVAFDSMGNADASDAITISVAN
ncbi:MAG: Ig-like domain-containing protein, partial [Acidimicrobiia bacterium]